MKTIIKRLKTITWRLKDGLPWAVRTIKNDYRTIKNDYKTIKNDYKMIKTIIDYRTIENDYKTIKRLKNDYRLQND